MLNTHLLNLSPPEPLHPDSPDVMCHCHDCGEPMDAQLQADGKGGFYVLVTCWNPQCLLRTVTRSLSSYASMTEAEFEAYREMNRQRQAEEG